MKKYILIIALVFSQATIADTITSTVSPYYFSGTVFNVTEIGPLLDGRINVGDLFSGSLQWDLSGEAPQAVLDVKVGDYMFSSVTTDMVVSDNLGGNDVLTFTSSSQSPFNTSSFAIPQLAFTDSTGLLIDGSLNGLPGYNFLTQFDGVSFSLSQTTHLSGGISSYSLDGNITNTSPVPVPAAAWLFMSGLLGLVGISRRKV